MGKKLKLFLCGFILACSSAITNSQQNEGFIPENAMLYKPFPIYKKWWNEISDCAQTRGRFNRIDWWMVGTEHTTSFKCPISSQYCLGWWKPNHSIYIARLRIGDEHIIKHEMLHDLLRNRNGSADVHHDLFYICNVK